MATMWEGSILRGQLVQPALGFAIVPDGPAVKLPVAEVASIVRATALPPAEVVKKVEELIKQLGSDESIKRDEVIRALIRMGAAARPILGRHLQNSDAEVRGRLRTGEGRRRPVGLNKEETDTCTRVYKAKELAC